MTDLEHAIAQKKLYFNHLQKSRLKTLSVGVLTERFIRMMVLDWRLKTLSVGVLTEQVLTAIGLMPRIEDPVRWGVNGTKDDI